MIRVLWIDDDLRYLEAGKDTLRSELWRLGITAEIETCARSFEGLGLLDDSPFDLILLDLHFASKDRLRDGFHFLDKLADKGIKTPVVIVSDYVRGAGRADETRRLHFESDLRNFKDQYLRAFSKTDRGRDELVQFISEFVSKPPAVIVLLSDLHLGSLSKRGQTLNDFTRDMELEFSEMRIRFKPNYLCVTGDFALKGKPQGLRDAAFFLRRTQQALNIEGSASLHFCAGNHDIFRGEHNPWQGFQGLIEALGESDSAIFRRFSTFRPELGELGTFQKQRDLLAISQGKDASVLFVAFNSVNPDQDNGHTGLIGNEQWSAFKTRMRKHGFPGSQLRIALLHHHMFPIPVDHSEIEERILMDHATALHQLRAAGIQLVMHGHAHFSCIHWHRFKVLNSFGNERQEENNEMVFIGAPTFNGTPDSGTPVRQYAIVTIGFYDPVSSSRSFEVHTRVYVPTERKWVDGQCVKHALPSLA